MLELHSIMDRIPILPAGNQSLLLQHKFVTLKYAMQEDLDGSPFENGRGVCKESY